MFRPTRTTAASSSSIGSIDVVVSFPSRTDTDTVSSSIDSGQFATCSKPSIAERRFREGTGDLEAA
ncbi:hypothetical protein BRC68_15785 [Halobacteriales archaeon QH_6_64_20]|nr:MAG: hypothetical protein BRC68_15785 [Halobacteriales archaeon QH_6_64_20]